MAFPKETKNEAYFRAKGKCECKRADCGHKGRCDKGLASGWHAHHVTSEKAGGSDGLSNCEALCIPCHQNTQSYGG